LQGSYFGNAADYMGMTVSVEVREVEAPAAQGGPDSRGGATSAAEAGNGENTELECA